MGNGKNNDSRDFAVTHHSLLITYDRFSAAASALVSSLAVMSTMGITRS